MVKRRSNPEFRADKGIVHRTGRDNRLEYTRWTGPQPVPVNEETRTVAGWRFTVTAAERVCNHPTLHVRDVLDALNEPHTVRPGSTTGTHVHERGLVKAIVRGRTVITVNARTD